jgi:hypothetical protein
MALGYIADDGPGPAIADPPPGAASLDPWLDTLEALARKRVGQREAWVAEARTRLAFRRECDE